MTSTHTQHHKELSSTSTKLTGQDIKMIFSKTGETTKANKYLPRGKDLRKAIIATDGKHIPKGRNKTVFANFPSSEAVKLSEKR